MSLGLATSVSEIRYLLPPSHDMTEIMLKRCKSSKQRNPNPFHFTDTVHLQRMTFPSSPTPHKITSQVSMTTSHMISVQSSLSANEAELPTLMAGVPTRCRMTAWTTLTLAPPTSLFRHLPTVWTN